MLKYHFLRNNVDREETFLARQAARGYVLRQVRGSRYTFDRPDKNVNYSVALRLTQSRTAAIGSAEHVVTIQFSREMFYNVLYTRDDQASVTLTSNPDAVDQYHTFMLDKGASQEWKGGAGLFAGVMMATAAAALAQASGLGGSWPVRGVLLLAGVLLAFAGVRGIFIGVSNAIGSVHPKHGAQVDGNSR